MKKVIICDSVLFFEVVSVLTKIEELDSEKFFPILTSSIQNFSTPTPALEYLNYNPTLSCLKNDSGSTPKRATQVTPIRTQ